jgi:N-glycosylase/DNA lyase
MHLAFRLEPPHPFDFHRTVLSHGFYQVPPFDWDRDEDCLLVALRPPLMTMRVSQTLGRGRRAVLHVDVRGRARRAPRGLKARLARTLAHVLDFDRDLRAFHKVCRSHEPLAWVPRSRAGRIMRCPDVFADVVVSICGTNTQWKQAVRCVHLLCEVAPRVPGTDLHCFPLPEEILAAGPSFLVDHARVGYRHRTILELCEKVLSGSIDLSVPLDPTVSGPDLREYFRSLPGIGPVTARYLAAVHGRTDELAVDSLVLRYIGDKYHGGRKPSVKAVEKRYAPFGDFRALAYWFEFLHDVDTVTWRGWK